MKIYYYGCLIPNDSDNLSKIKIDYYTESGLKTNNISRSKIGIDMDDFRYLQANLNKYNGVFAGVSDEKLKKILSNLNFSKTVNNRTNIVFEVIKDENDIMYAKELLTGLIFPLDDNGKYEYFYNLDGNEVITQSIVFRDKNMARTKYIARAIEVASVNKINEYKLMKKQKEAVIKKYNENVFNNEIVEKKEKILEKQSEYTKLMEEIDLLLEFLKQKNYQTYLKINSEYKKIKIGKQDTLVAIAPSIEDFKRFVSKIKLHLIVEKDFKDLSNYLFNAIENYFIKMVTNSVNTKDLNIGDLDNITEMFLISKEDYDIEVQRHILKQISMLYLFIIKSNIDNINVNKLNESYFKDNLKTILLHILALNDMEIIKNIPDINFDDNITVESIFNMIKEIEFNKHDKEKVKNLIK